MKRKLKLKTSFFLSLIFLCRSLAWAGASAQPIETKMDLGFWGIFGCSMEYSMEGKKISRYEDFKSLLYPLGDKEASSLIREAESDHVAAMVLYGAGLATGLDLALFFKPNPLLNIDWFDRFATGLIAAQIFAGLGGIFDGNAEGRKYNAVQRYNQLAKANKEETWLNLSPLLSPADHRLGLVLSKSF